MSQYPEYLPDELSPNNISERIEKIYTKYYNLTIDNYCNSDLGDKFEFSIGVHDILKKKIKILGLIRDKSSIHLKQEFTNSLGSILENVVNSIVEISVYSDLYGKTSPEVIDSIKEAKELYPLLLDMFCLSELDIMPENIRKQEWGEKNV